MNICFCIDTLQSGGAERVVSTLCNKLSENNDIFLILTSVCKDDELFYKIDDRVTILYGRNKKQKDSFLKNICKIRKCIKNVRPDVLISFLPHVNIKIYLANLFLKIPHIVSERNNPYVDPPSLFQRKFKEFVFYRASGCVFQTKDAMNYYGKRVLKKSEIIYNPVNLYVEPNFNKRFEHNIIAIGRLSPQKNFPCLLKAFSLFLPKNPDYILNIVGDGFDKQNLIDMCRNLNVFDNVVFHGESKTWQKDFINSGMFVLSSDYEGMPNVLAEALSLGIPCISSDCPIGGPKELIKDGCNGYLFKVGDEKELSEKMIKILDTDLNKNNKDLYLKLSAENISKQWLSFIKKIVEEK